MCLSFASLRNRNYRLLIAGNTITNFGSWIERLCQAWLVLQLSDNSAAAVGVTTTLQFAPFFFLSRLGGHLADRYKKKTVLLVTQCIQAASMLVLGMLVLTEEVTLLHVNGLALIFGCAAAIDGPARHSIGSELVEKEHISNAVIINSLSYSTARLVGPAVAGVLVSALGVGIAILVSIIPYVCMITALLFIKIDEPLAATGVRTGASLGGGRSGSMSLSPEVMAALCILFFVSCFGLKFQMTTALMATEVYYRGAEIYGALGSALAVGSLAFALVATTLRTVKFGYVLISAFFFGLIEFLSSLMPSLWSFFVILPILGFTSSAIFTLTNSIVQTATAPEYRGRAMANYNLVNLGASPLGAPIIGVIGDRFGARSMLFSGGALSLLGVAIAYLYMRVRAVRNSEALNR